MRHRRSITVLSLVLLAGCAPSPQNTRPPAEKLEPLREAGKTFQIKGVVTGPKVLLSTTEYPLPATVFSDQPLPGVSVYAADSTRTPLKDAQPVKTNAQGAFTLTTPEREGILLAVTSASASSPLMAFYHDGNPANISVASTLVTYKLSVDMATKSFPIQKLDPAKFQKAVQLVDAQLRVGIGGGIKPDYSITSWVDALDMYTYHEQGTIAKAFNDLIPGSVAPKMSR